MAKYSNKKKIARNHKTFKRMLKKIAIFGAVGALTIMPITVKGMEQQKVKQIEENAQKKVPRSFKNINQEDMGKYLKAQIETLYQTYPDLDEWMYEDSLQTSDSEFINAIYRLYKAYMVDIADKPVESMDNVTVTTVDQMIVNSDLIQEKQEDGETKDILKTYKEQYKEITNDYIKAEKGEITGAKLGKEIYELLAVELGLDDKVATSEEIDKQMKDKGFYYDEKNNVFYTKEGKAELVSKETTENTRSDEENLQKIEDNDREL